MIQTSHNTDQALKELFQKLPKEEIPANLTAEIVKHICREEKKRTARNTWLAWLSVCGISVLMVFSGLWLLRYLSIDLSEMFKEWPTIPIGGTTFFICLIGGIATLLLLFIDSYLRKRYLR